MGALVGLHRLSLAHNKLERRLTDHVGLLTSLTNLDLSSNSIGHLPPSLGGLEVRGVNKRTQRKSYTGTRTALDKVMFVSLVHIPARRCDWRSLDGTSVVVAMIVLAYFRAFRLHTPETDDKRSPTSVSSWEAAGSKGVCHTAQYSPCRLSQYIWIRGVTSAPAARHAGSVTALGSLELHEPTTTCSNYSIHT